MKQIISLLLEVVRHKGNVILLTTEGNKVDVHCGNKSSSEVKDIATLFFKEAYKLHI